MTRSIRFQLDEHLDNAIAQALRLRNIGVSTVTEAGLRGRGDEEILAECNRTCRVVTFDDDYLRLHHRGAPHQGIVYFGASGRTLSHIVACLILVHEVLNADDMTGHVEFL